MQELTLLANGISFHALAEGPENGPLVLLLHGFPELSISWESQLRALGNAGYRAIAPDMRGYGETDRTGPYDLQTLARDVAGLVAACGRKRAAIVGHDWGGGVAWGAAIFEPQVVERLCILNCPHPAAFARALLGNPLQILRSWYMFFFQIPWLPEIALRLGNGFAVARGLTKGSAVSGVWSEARLQRYRRAISQPGAARAAIDYYRAAFRNPRQIVEAKSRLITAPTQIIWGSADPFIQSELAAPEAMRRYFAPGNEPLLELISEAGHFVQNEAPEQVNEILLRALAPMLEGAVGQLSHAAKESLSP